MKVQKRDGSFEPVRLDAIADRLRGLSALRFPVHAPHLELYTSPLDAVDVDRIATVICRDIHDGIQTGHIDELAAEVAVGLATEHYQYGLLAARILISDLHKTTTADALAALSRTPNISPELLEVVAAHGQEIQGWLDFDLDYMYDFFSFKTWKKMYLLGEERPQHAFLRVALGIWGSDLVNARETYRALAMKRFTHASPTLFNAGTTRPQMASCFLTGIFDDSLDGIFTAYHDIAKISKFGGGIGLHVHKVRSKGAPIGGTGGSSDGLVPMLRVSNEVIRYINQSGRRLGSMAVYLEISHPDVMDFLDLRRNQGDEHLRARDLFTALWIPDIFMEAVRRDGEWHLVDPHACPGLDDLWGPAYNEAYARIVAEKRYAAKVRARDVWNAILRSQIETGTPYLLYKDAVNGKSNQQHLGTIKCSNLCTEIVEYTAPDEVAVCTLGSVCLPACVNEEKVFDFEALDAVTSRLARNLDRVIDVTYYPIPATRVSNARHRPIGIGVQGLQDVFFMLGLPFDSPEARILNIDIFRTMYIAALRTSNELARALGPHPSFPGSPASQGRLQPDLWGLQEPGLDPLRAAIREHGLRNSLSLAPMPTASTAQLMGNYEAFEPQTSNVFVRKTLAGDFVVVNSFLQKDLMARGLWTQKVRNDLLRHDGKVDFIADPDVRELYRTAWELSMKSLIDMAADRGPYVCQSQSLNLFVESPSHGKLSSMHFYAWERGLKTGMYYLRTRPTVSPVKITVETAEAEENCVHCSG